LGAKLRPQTPRADFARTRKLSFDSVPLVRQSKVLSLVANAI